MSTGIRHDDLRRRNRAMVIGAVRRAGRASRTDIAAVTRLSHSTISAISADLLAEGILVETKPGETGSLKRGRPQVALALEPGAATVIAMVLSLNTLSAAIIDYAGGLVAEEHRRLATLDLPRSELGGECLAMIRRLLAAHGGAGRPLRVVFAVQGVVDAASRALLWSPITPHQQIAFADLIEREFGMPTSVENDCNMMAVALRWRDPERYRSDFLAVLLSHGIGMGLVLKGQLFTGTQSSGAEFGHMIHRPGGALCRCGRRGCIEAYAGNYAILRTASGGSEDDPPAHDMSDAEMMAIIERARAGDRAARKAFEKAGEALGYGLGSVFALIDPAPVAFIGTGAAAFDLLGPPLRAAIARTAGGRHSAAISFDTVADEMPLIRQGCAMQALTFVDGEIFAPGLASLDPAGKNVA